MSQVSKKQGMELTFHACLIQVLQDKTNDMMNENQYFVHSVKQAGNKFIKEIDLKLNVIYGPCKPNEIDQGMNLIKLITEKIDEAHAEYVKEFEKGNI